MAEKKHEQTVSVGGRSYKIHAERGGPGDRWSWRYEAGVSSINAGSALELMRRLAKESVSSSNRKDAVLAACDALDARLTKAENAKADAGWGGNPGFEQSAKKSREAAAKKHGLTSEQKRIFKQADEALSRLHGGPGKPDDIDKLKAARELRAQLGM